MNDDAIIATEGLHIEAIVRGSESADFVDSIGDDDPSRSLVDVDLVVPAVAAHLQDAAEVQNVEERGLIAGQGEIESAFVAIAAARGDDFAVAIDGDASGI